MVDAVVKYEVIASRPGGLEIKFVVRDSTLTVFIPWNGQGGFDQFITKHIPYMELLAIEAGDILREHIGKKGEVEVPVIIPSLTLGG